MGVRLLFDIAKVFILLIEKQKHNQIYSLDKYIIGVTGL